jgi:hypothetical protein
MTLQEYYELQGKLKMLDAAMATMDATIEEVRDTFSKIDPTQLGVGSASQTSAVTPTVTLTPPAAPVPVAQPKQRKKLNAPVLTGPLKDVVEDMLSQKAADEEAAAAPKRIAPYEAEIKSIGIGPGGEFYATVYDAKNNEEAMVEVPKSTYEEFQRDPDGLVIDLNGYMLEKAEWLPVNTEPTTDVAEATTTEA